MPRQSRGLKTRSGCAQCKQRRVKCDEKKPSCFNCTRFNRVCSFLLTEPFLLRSRALLRPTLLNAAAHLQPQSRLMQKDQDSQSMRPCETAFMMEDMRLLHYFTTQTAETLSDCPEAQMAWRTSVVECAFQNPFLLQGILAVTALHMAIRNPQQERRLSILAASKQSTALHEFRTQLERITPENCDALFAFSFLTSYYIPASAGTVINPSASFLEDDIFNAMVYWLRLCRGTSSIYQCAKEWIRHGRLANLWNIQYPEYDRHREVRGEYSLPAPYEERLRDLEELCKPVIGPEAVLDEIGVEEREVNTQSLIIFLRLFHCVYDQHRVDVSSPRGLRFMSADDAIKADYSNRSMSKQVYSTQKMFSVFSLSLAWLFEIPLGFIELLEQRRPISLVIFAHFSLLLCHAPQFWWNGAIARKIVQAVTTSLAPRYHNWIQWPVHEILQQHGQASFVRHLVGKEGGEGVPGTDHLAK